MAVHLLTKIPFMKNAYWWLLNKTIQKFLTIYMNSGHVWNETGDLISMDSFHVQSSHKTFCRPISFKSFSLDCSLPLKEAHFVLLEITHPAVDISNPNGNHTVELRIGVKTHKYFIFAHRISLRIIPIPPSHISSVNNNRSLWSIHIIIQVDHFEIKHLTL